MIEPVTTLGVIVVALVAKALNRVGDEVVEAGFETMRRVVDVLREQFTQAGDEESLKALERVEDAPDSPSRQRQLADLVDIRAEQSSELRLALEGLIEEAKRAGVDVGSIEQTAVGSQNVQSASLFNSQVNVRQDGSRSPRD